MRHNEAGLSAEQPARSEVVPPSRLCTDATDATDESELGASAVAPVPFELDHTDAHADGAVFRELYPTLRRFAAVVGDAGSDPDDLVQEALVRVLTRGPLSRLDRPEAYLRRTILNVVLDGQRRGIRWRAVLGRSGRPDDHHDSPPSELADLDQLSPTDRAVIWLTEIEGYPHADAAALLGLSPDAVRSRASRSRRRLRAAIETSEET